MDKIQLAAAFAEYFDEHINEILADLGEIIAINSIADENSAVRPFGEGSAKALAWGEEKLKALGMTTRNFDNYAVRGDYCDGEEPVLGVLAHLDTVPVSSNWSYPPFELTNKDGVLYGAGLIGEEGSADIAIEPIQSGGDVTICVTGLDKIPYIVTIPAASLEGAYIVYNNVQCENPVYGAYVNPTVTLKNVGVEAANDITVTLSTESEYIDLINATATVANIAPDATFDITDFTFDVAVNIPDNTKVQFFVTCVSGDNTWESKFNIIFSAPKFVTANIFNTELTAGGTGTATFQFTNNGGAEAQNAVFEVYSSSDDLVLESNTFEIGAIASGETVEIPVNITVGSNVELGSTYELSYLMSAGHYAISGSYIITVGNIIEGFETGDFSTYNWQFGGSSNWTVVNTGAYNGTYCAKSGAISDSQQTDLILTTEVLADGEISFYKKVSSENNYDKLYFYIDNQEKGNWSGDVAWSQTSFPVTAGTHTFKWSYKKDYSMSSGSDCAWIDDIQFPPTNVELALAPVTDLMAEVDDHIVTLTWEASEDGFEYIVRRNGEVIATTITLTISDIVPEDGIYTYSVVATNDEGLYSAPEHVTVNVGTVGVEENTLDNVSIYPNPVNDMLIINGGNAEFDYVMYNGMGQMVANGTANGTVQVNVSGMAKGVYFLRLNTGSQVRIDKVIVK